MKQLAFALALLSSIAYAQSDASLNGKWKMHTSVAGTESDSQCTFTQNDKDITGTCKAADQSNVKISGQIDDTKLTLTGNSGYNGTPLTIKYNGTLASGKITGDVNVGPFGVTGNFTLTRDTTAK